MISLSRNGQQIGTFSLEDINRMLASRQLTGTEHWWQEGMANWQPLSALPGVVMPAAPANPYAASGAAYGGHPAMMPPKTSGLAVASMVLGILSLILFFTHIFAAVMALLAVIFGHISLSSIRNSRGALTGRGMGITGCILGYLTMIVLAVIVFFVATLFSKVANDPNFRKDIEQIGEEFRKSAEEGDRQSRMQEELDRISKQPQNNQ